MLKLDHGTRIGEFRAGLLAAALFILLPEALRFAGFSGAVPANLKQIIFGIALVIVMLAQVCQQNNSDF